MGSFYTNYTLKGPSQQDVAEVLAGRRAVVAPLQNGSVVVFDEQSDEQDQHVISELAAGLSGEFKCPVLAVLNHDDDILWYRLYDSGCLADEYDSSPGYFDEDAEPSAPVGGKTEHLARLFGVTDSEELETILRKSSYDDDGYVFALDRHSDLVRVLGLPEFAVGVAYASFERDEFPDGLTRENIITTK